MLGYLLKTDVKEGEGKRQLWDGERSCKRLMGDMAAPRLVTLNPPNTLLLWKEVMRRAPCSNISAGQEAHSSPKDLRAFTQPPCGQWDDDFSCLAR